MRFLRRLVRHGNSMHVSFPPEMIRWLQWNPQQGLVVEAQLDRTVVVRPARPDDMSVPQQPMTLDTVIPGAPR